MHVIGQGPATVLGVKLKPPESVKLWKGYAYTDLKGNYLTRDESGGTCNLKFYTYEIELHDAATGTKIVTENQLEKVRAATRRKVSGMNGGSDRFAAAGRGVVEGCPLGLISMSQ